MYIRCTRLKVLYRFCCWRPVPFPGSRPQSGFPSAPLQELRAITWQPQIYFSTTEWNIEILTDIKYELLKFCLIVDKNFDLSTKKILFIFIQGCSFCTRFIFFPSWFFSSKEVGKWKNIYRTFIHIIPPLAYSSPFLD